MQTVARRATGLLALASAAMLLTGTAADAADITGAGATFPFPIYAKWAEAYRAKTGVGLNYQSIGSGGGIRQITAKTVDFGASDAPLKPEQLDKEGLVQFPTVMGGVVPVVNVRGVEARELKLSGPLLADIFLGKVRKWNDPAIARLNPGLSLPDRAITVVHRSDGSGTTFIFANYLSKVSPEWKAKVGEGTAVQWPTGVGGKGNEGVASYVQRINGAIGYVEYAYAFQNKLAYGLMQNRAGEFVRPTAESFQAAAAGADWKGTPGFGVILTDQAAKGAWPIAGATFVLMHRQQARPETAREVLKFFAWAYENGDAMASELHYVPMPNPVVAQVEALWREQIKGPGGQPIWSTSGQN
ncbi:MAG TPA: phosphate ABC transporter substrate-binding protein PstS [Thermodesulfobacteriota bacterium]